MYMLRTNLLCGLFFCGSYFFHLFVITDKRHVEEVLLLPDGVEGRAHVVLEVVPFQTELFISSHFGKSLGQKFVEKLLKYL